MAVTVTESKNNKSIPQSFSADFSAAARNARAKFLPTFSQPICT